MTFEKDMVHHPSTLSQNRDNTGIEEIRENNE